MGWPGPRRRSRRRSRRPLSRPSPSGTPTTARSAGSVRLTWICCNWPSTATRPRASPRPRRPTTATTGRSTSRLLADLLKTIDAKSFSVYVDDPAITGSPTVNLQIQNQRGTAIDKDDVDLVGDPAAPGSFITAKPVLVYSASYRRREHVAGRQVHAAGDHGSSNDQVVATYKQAAPGQARQRKRWPSS